MLGLHTVKDIAYVYLFFSAVCSNFLASSCPLHCFFFFYLHKRVLGLLVLLLLLLFLFFKVLLVLGFWLFGVFTVEKSERRGFCHLIVVHCSQRSHILMYKNLAITVSCISVMAGDFVSFTYLITFYTNYVIYVYSFGF